MRKEKLPLMSKFETQIWNLASESDLGPTFGFSLRPGNRAAWYSERLCKCISHISTCLLCTWESSERKLDLSTVFRTFFGAKIGREKNHHLFQNWSSKSEIWPPRPIWVSNFDIRGNFSFRMFFASDSVLIAIKSSNFLSRHSKRPKQHVKVCERHLENYL